MINIELPPMWVCVSVLIIFLLLVAYRYKDKWWKKDINLSPQASRKLAVTLLAFFLCGAYLVLKQETFWPSVICLLIVLYQYRDSKMFCDEKAFLETLVAAVVMVCLGVCMIFYTASTSPEMSLLSIKGFFHSTPSIWPALIVVVAAVIIWLIGVGDCNKKSYVNSVNKVALIATPLMAVAVTLIHVNCHNFLVWVTVLGVMPFVGCNLPDKNVSVSLALVLVVQILAVWYATTIPITWPRLTPFVEWVVMVVVGIAVINICDVHDIGDEEWKSLQATPPITAIIAVALFLLLNKFWVGIIFVIVMIIVIYLTLVTIEDSQKKKKNT